MPHAFAGSETGHRARNAGVQDRGNGPLAAAARLASPIGMLTIWCTRSELVAIDIDDEAAAVAEPHHPLAVHVAHQLMCYFEDPNWDIDLPLAISGTPFQRRVWQVLRSIAVGDVVSYGALADYLGTSARAVGGACKANPVPLVVPCHRVVAARGLGGYKGQQAGRALAVKRWLIEHERRGAAQACCHND